MRKLFIALLMVVSTSIFAQTGEKNFIDQNYIEVIGKSEMEITPDLIFLKVILNEKDNKNKITISDLESQMIQKLEKIGIDVKKDVQIRDIASNFKSYFLRGNDIILMKEYQILVHDGKTASRVFVELEKIGISNVSIDRLDNSNIVQFRKEIKVNAVKAAKEKADALAGAINQTAGRSLYIQELENNLFNPRTANVFMFEEKVGSTSEPNVDFEKIKLDYSVLCRFELK
jgi:uncharacterized protein YggE